MKLHSSTDKKIARNVKRLREAQGLSAKALADRIGASRQYVYLIEDAQRVPSLTILTRIAKALRTQIGELLA